MMILDDLMRNMKNSTIHTHDINGNILKVNDWIEVIMVFPSQNFILKIKKIKETSLEGVVYIEECKTGIMHCVYNTPVRILTEEESVLYTLNL